MTRDGLTFTPCATLPTLRPGRVVWIGIDDRVWLYDRYAARYAVFADWWARQIVACWFAVTYYQALVWWVWYGNVGEVNERKAA